MPHNGLMDTTKMSKADAALISARFHLRGGKRNLQRGLSIAGIAALYEAVLCGMHYYIVKHKGCVDLVANTDLWDATSLFQALTRAGVFDDPLLFNRFSLTVERALWQTSFSFDPDAVLAEAEIILTKLGVVPRNESALPDGFLSVQ